MCNELAFRLQDQTAILDVNNAATRVQTTHSTGASNTEAVLVLWPMPCSRDR